MSDAEAAMRKALDGHKWRWGLGGSYHDEHRGDVVTDAYKSKPVKDRRFKLKPQDVERLKVLHDSGLSVACCAKIMGMPRKTAQSIIIKISPERPSGSVADRVSLSCTERVTFDQIVRAVAAVCDVPPAAILGRSRHRRFVFARQIVCFLARDVASGLSFPQIGYLMGLDHTTVLHSARKVRGNGALFQPELGMVLQRLATGDTAE